MWLKIKNLSWIFALVAGLLTMGCLREGNNHATLQVRLTDAPGDYEEVNVDIQDVQINRSTDEQGWESIDMPSKGVYNLLDLTNGVDTLLGEYTLPAGNISQIRLVLGTNNSIKVDGNTYDLTTPSAQQSGLKVNVQATLADGVNYTILLDFDAGKSVVARGNNTYSLKPVIRAITQALNGAITGSITPVDANPAVYAIIGTDTVASTFPDQDGKFLLRSIPANTYEVHFEPKTGYSPKQISDVVVTNGNVTDLGVTTIE